MSKTKHPANMVILTDREQFVHIFALLFTQADDYVLTPIKKYVRVTFSRTDCN